MALPVCTIDENGIFKPDYATVKAYLENEFKLIYGDDVYIDPDSQDGQLLAIFASAIDDANAMAVQVYNNYSPSTARGVGLSSAVKINGIARKVATYSSVDLRIVGQIGTTILNGIAKDVNGKQWLLPASVVIPLSGEITVTAVAKELGAIQAAIGDVNVIGTPTRGWQSVENLVVATPGATVELDSELRQRQTVSTAIPSLTVFEGTMGAVASLEGVERYRGYENDTNLTDSNGLPPHSISLVVDGGSAQKIGEAIAAKKTPGTGTYGTTSVDVIDEYGVAREIQFFRPTEIGIKAEVLITALVGYNSIIGEQIKQALADYVNNIQIGDDVVISRLYLPANLYGNADSSRFEISSLQIAKLANALGTADIPIAFNEAATMLTSNIALVVSS